MRFKDVKIFVAGQEVRGLTDEELTYEPPAIGMKVIEGHDVCIFQFEDTRQYHSAPTAFTMALMTDKDMTVRERFTALEKADTFMGYPCVGCGSVDPKNPKPPSRRCEACKKFENLQLGAPADVEIEEVGRYVFTTKKREGRSDAYYIDGRRVPEAIFHERLRQVKQANQ